MGIRRTRGDRKDGKDKGEGRDLKDRVEWDRQDGIKRGGAQRVQINRGGTPTVISILYMLFTLIKISIQFLYIKFIEFI